MHDAARFLDMADLPVDPRLPSLTVAFDVGRIAKLVELHVEFQTDSPTCQVSYVRYKPGTSCIVALSFDARGKRTPTAGYVKVYTEHDYHIVRAKLARRSFASYDPHPPYVALDDSHAVLYLFPNDAELSGLRVLTNAKLLQRALYAHNDEYPKEKWRISDSRMTTQLIRYKPEKRAVLRIDTRAIDRVHGERRELSVFGRVYLPGRARDHFALMGSLERAASGCKFRVPHALGYLPADDLVLVSCLAGEPVSTLELASGSVPDQAARAGAALCELHALKPEPLGIRSREDSLADCAATVGSLGAVAPELWSRATTLLEKLRLLSEHAPARNIGFVHGDFHPGQLLLSETGLGVLDFDRAQTAECAQDLGNFRAHLLAALSGTIASRESTAQTFIASYCAAGGEAPPQRNLDFWTTVGLMNLTVQPFRSLEAGWRARMATLLSCAEAVLSV